MILSETGGRGRRGRRGRLLCCLAVPKVVAVRCDWTLVTGKGKKRSQIRKPASCQPPSLVMVLLEPVFILFLFSFKYCLAATQAGPDALASQYALTTSTSMPFPTATMSTTDTQALLVSKWSLGKGRIQDNPQNLAFVDDPFPDKPPPGTTSSGPSSPVLQVTYPSGSFSHDTGGAQLYTLWNTTDGSSFNTMMVTYEVAFDAGFDWVKGGKLPGLRGGLNSSGCSGGNKSDGLECFSSRIMWRTNGAAEGILFSSLSLLSI